MTDEEERAALEAVHRLIGYQHLCPFCLKYIYVREDGRVDWHYARSYMLVKCQGSLLFLAASVL